MRVLVTAASRHGATAEIADAIAESLERRGLEADVLHPNHVGSLDGYDAVVLGSAVYSGHWSEDAKLLVHRSAHALSHKPLWLFSSGRVGDPSTKMAQQMEADPVDLEEIRAASHALGHHMFAGKLDRRELSFGQRIALSLFPGLQGDFRDWDEIDGWAEEIATALTQTGVVGVAT